MNGTWSGSVCNFVHAFFRKLGGPFHSAYVALGPESRMPPSSRSRSATVFTVVR